MRKKISNLIIYIIIITGIALLFIGVFKVWSVKNEIEKGVKEVEEIFGNTKEEETIQTSTTVQIKEETKDNSVTPIGLLTFKLEKDYKVAIYNNVTTETLKKGAGRLTGSSNLNEKRKLHTIWA